MSEWTEFLKRHAGKGYSMAKMADMYRKQKGCGAGFIGELFPPAKIFGLGAPKRCPKGSRKVCKKK